MGEGTTELVTGELPWVELRSQIIDICRRMNKVGINQGTSGNVSCRLPGDDGFLLTASGIPYDVMEPQHVVHINWDGGWFGHFPPSSEWKMHRDIYVNRPEAQAVLHAHPIHCTALAAQRRGIPPFHYMVAAVAMGKEIQCADYATFGTQELSDNMLAALGNRRSVLLANHGMVCHAPSLEKALWVATETEVLAKQFLLAESTGSKPHMLSNEEMDIMLSKFRTYGKQPHELKDLTDFDKIHGIKAPSRKADGLASVGGCVEFLEMRKEVIETCLKMDAMGINQGTSGNCSSRVPGGFVITASGVPYDKMVPEQVVFMDMEGNYYGDFAPSSEWRMHYDIYKNIPEASAVVHAHPAYCTALSSLRRNIPGFHYMVAAGGSRTIPCTDYATFSTQGLSDAMLSSMGSDSKCVLLANHGMICYGNCLGKALWLAIETETLAKQYVAALASGSPPIVLSDVEMDIMLIKFKTYGKPPSEVEKLSASERKHAIFVPRCMGPERCGCGPPPAKAPRLTAVAAADCAS